jgi:hypothetical protein
MKISSPSLNIFYNLFYFRGFFNSKLISWIFIFTWNLSIFRPYLAVLSHWIYSTIVFLLFFCFVLCMCCLRFEYFQPSAELCFFVHIILQVCEIWFKISMCICSDRIPSHEYSLLPGIYLFLDLILRLCYFHCGKICWLSEVWSFFVCFTGVSFASNI